MRKETRKNKKKAAKSGRYDIKKLGLRAVIVLVAAYFIYVMIWQQVMISNKNEEIEALSKNIEQATQESERLRQEVENLSDPEYIERIARETLGLVRPNERVFVDSNKSEDNTGR